MNRLLFGHLSQMLPPLFQRFTPDQLEAIMQFLEVGTWINRQRAALLQDHLPAANVSGMERIKQAEAFDQDAQKLARAVGEQIRDGGSPKDFSDPAARET
jgi:hypothetical protein